MNKFYIMRKDKKLFFINIDFKSKTYTIKNLSGSKLYLNDNSNFNDIDNFLIDRLPKERNNGLYYNKYNSNVNKMKVLRETKGRKIGDFIWIKFLDDKESSWSTVKTIKI